MKKQLGLSLIFMVVVVAAIFSANPALAYDSSSPMVLKCAIDNPPGDMKAQTIKNSVI
jgi:hypothetical protein